MFSLFCLFVALAVSHFGFEGMTLVLIVPFLVIAYLLLFKMHQRFYGGVTVNSLLLTCPHVMFNKFIW